MTSTSPTDPQTPTDRQTPTDPQALRNEIALTRTELGATVVALAAKTDVKARASEAVGQLTDQAKEKVHAVREQAGDVASTVRDRVRSSSAAVRDSVHDSVHDMDVPEAVRKPVPVAAIAAGVALAGLVIYLIWRRRS